MKIRKKRRQILAVVLAVVLTVTICMPILFSNSSADAAGDGDAISDVLSKYQFFVEGDATLTGGSHTVGAIAVGGTYSNTNTFGDAAIVPSYIGTYAGGAQGNGWNGTPPDGFTKNNTVYYGDVADGVSVDSSWIQDAGYINMNTEFAAIRTQSQAISKIGTQVEAADVVNGELTLSCDTDDTYFVLPFDIFNSVNSVNIVTPDGDIDYFRSYTCVISIVDVNGNQVTLDNWSKVKINGTHMSSAFERMSGWDKDYNTQLNFNGLNFVFNLPDATGSIAINGLGGHLVAPNAAVDTGSANYEGGIIAKTLTGASEGHFYPMSKKLLIENDTGKLVITKTIKGDVTEAEAEGALRFKVTAPDGIVTEYDLKKFDHTENTNIYTLTIENAQTGTYQVEETTSDITGKTVTVKYSVGGAEAQEGKKTEAEVSKDATQTVAFENDYTNDTGKLVITKTIKGDVTEAEAEGDLKFEVTAPDGTVTEYDLKKFDHTENTNIYTLTIENAQTGTYQVEETTSDITGKTVTVKYSVGDGAAQEGTSASAEVSKDATQTVAFENDYKEIDGPTPEPTATPTADPTEKPTEKPTEAPTEEPTVAPVGPTTKPGEPTVAPAKPTVAPTATPVVKPTEAPTEGGGDSSEDISTEDNKNTTEDRTSDGGTGDGTENPDITTEDNGNTTEDNNTTTGGGTEDPGDDTTTGGGTEDPDDDKTTGGGTEDPDDTQDGGTTEAEKPDDSNQVKTGDSAPIIPVVIVMAASLCAAGLLVVTKKKDKK